MKKIVFIFIVVILYSCNNKKEAKHVGTNTIAETTDTSNISKETDIKTSIPQPKVTITKALVLGKFNFTKDTSFVEVAAKHSSKSLYLNKQAYAAFVKMHNAAAKDGVTLTIISGTRNFWYQKGIWERKWAKYASLAPADRAKKILEFSSMPCTSRHHWGTDMDINNLENSYFKTGKGKKEYDWLQKHAATYGFYQVYTDKDSGRTGYNLEKWHWSYLPLAKQYLEYYNKNVSYADISDFKGAELAKELDVINLYVNGIPETLKE